VLLLRLTVTHGGQLASDADLLVIPGQTANLTVPMQGGQSLKYRIGTSADEPTRLTVWLEVSTPHGGEALGALSTNLDMDPGQKVTAGQLATTAGEYELKIALPEPLCRRASHELTGLLILLLTIKDIGSAASKAP